MGDVSIISIIPWTINPKESKALKQIQADTHLDEFDKAVVHCKKYLGVVPRFTKKKVALSLPLHTLAVSFGNILVAVVVVW